MLLSKFVFVCSPSAPDPAPTAPVVAELSVPMLLLFFVEDCFASSKRFRFALKARVSASSLVLLFRCGPRCSFCCCCCCSCSVCAFGFRVCHCVVLFCSLQLVLRTAKLSRGTSSGPWREQEHGAVGLCSVTDMAFPASSIFANPKFSGALITLRTSSTASECFGLYEPTLVPIP